jgi:hypothetical protein
MRDSKLSGASRELYSLGCICNRFSLRPFCRVDASAQFGEFRFRNIYMKRTTRILISCLRAPLWRTKGLGHGVFLFRQFRNVLVCRAVDSCAAIVSFLNITFAAIQHVCCDDGQGLQYAERNVSKILVAHPHLTQLVG